MVLRSGSRSTHACRSRAHLLPDAHSRCPTTVFALRVGGFALITDVYLSARTHLTPSPRRLKICNVNESCSLAVKTVIGKFSLTQFLASACF